MKDQIKTIADILNKKEKIYYDRYGGTMPFGKYKGESIKEIGKKDIRYLDWLAINADGIIKIQAKEAIELTLAKISIRSANRTKLMFGKHSGKTVAKISHIDLKYLGWLAQSDYPCPIIRHKAKLIYSVKNTWLQSDENDFTIRTQGEDQQSLHR